VKLAQIIFEKCYSNIAVGLPPTALSTAQFRRPENKLGDSFRVADNPGTTPFNGHKRVSQD